MEFIKLYFVEVVSVIEKLLFFEDPKVDSLLYRFSDPPAILMVYVILRPVALVALGLIKAQLQAQLQTVFKQKFLSWVCY